MPYSKFNPCLNLAFLLNNQKDFDQLETLMYKNCKRQEDEFYLSCRFYKEEYQNDIGISEYENPDDCQLYKDSDDDSDSMKENYIMTKTDPLKEFTNI